MGIKRRCAEQPRVEVGNLIKVINYRCKTTVQNHYSTEEKLSSEDFPTLL